MDTPLEGLTTMDTPLEGLTTMDTPLEGLTTMDTPLEGPTIMLVGETEGVRTNWQQNCQLWSPNSKMASSRVHLAWWSLVSGNSGEILGY